MIEAYKNNKKFKLSLPKEVKPDTIITRFHTIEEYNEKGEKITKIKEERVNLTKICNESKKLIKTQNAQEKLDELARIFTK